MSLLTAPSRICLPPSCVCTSACEHAHVDERSRRVRAAEWTAKDKKAGVLKCHTLLSTATTLPTCDVSTRIIVAHWACADQAPSRPRVCRVRTRCSRGWVRARVPGGGKRSSSHVFIYLSVTATVAIPLDVCLCRSAAVGDIRPEDGDPCLHHLHHYRHHLRHHHHCQLHQHCHHHRHHHDHRHLHHHHHLHYRHYLTYSVFNNLQIPLCAGSFLCHLLPFLSRFESVKQVQSSSHPAVQHHCRISTTGPFLDLNQERSAIYLFIYRMTAVRFTELIPFDCKQNNCVQQLCHIFSSSRDFWFEVEQL